MGVTCVRKTSSEGLSMNSTTPPPPPPPPHDVAVGYVLVPFFLITVIGVLAAVVGAVHTHTHICTQALLCFFWVFLSGVGEEGEGA